MNKRFYPMLAGALFLATSLGATAQETSVWSETFDTASSMDSFTVDNVNGDANAWKYSASRELAYYNGSECPNTADDWLFSPALSLKKGEVYRLRFMAKSLSNQYREVFSIKIGQNATPEAMVTQLLAPTVLQANTKKAIKELTFRVPADGNYYLGFYAESEAMQMGVMLDDLYLTKICNSTAPAQPELTVTPGACGAISCSGTVTVPATDVDGNAAGAVAKVEILRQKQKNMKLEYNENPWEPVFSGENVLPGDELTFTDATAAEGLYIYKAVASNAYGSGMERKVVTVIGEDIPAAVSGVAVDRLDGNSVSVSWTAPEKGVNGGYISPENLKYVLELNDDSGFRELEGEYTGTCYTVSIPTSDAKSPFSVTIRPYNTTGTGDNAKTTVFTSGEHYKLPFHDSFYLDKNNLEGLPVWICPQVDYRSWMLMSDMSQDGDNYCSVVYMGKSHTTLDMLSSEIDFSDASNAYVEFWYYLEPQYGNPILQTVVSVDYGEWMLVGEEMHLATAAGETPQWKEVKVPLSSYDGEKNVRVGLRATSTTPYDMLLVDNFTVDQGWTGVDGVVQAAATAIAKRGEILVSGYAQQVRIYNLNGVEVSAFSLEGEKLISVAPGIYIVNMDGTSMKLLVK